MKKVAIVLGTRPEAIKLIPVYKALQKSNDIEAILISTGQHREMLDQIFDFFDTSADHDLRLMTHNQSLAALTSKLYLELDQIFQKIAPDLVVVQGDTSTAMVGAHVAFYNNIKCAHVEAGLRTYNKWAPFPEEVNRQFIGKVADYHYAPTKAAVETLRSEKIAKENVILSGNTVIDSLLEAREKVKGREDFKSKYDNIIASNEQVVLVTGHRRESFGQGFEEICAALLTLSERYQNLRFLYPVHLNPKVKDIVEKRLSSQSNISLVAPLPYDELVYVMSRSYLILTDSGGIQEEAPSMNVPVVVMRESTERQEGIDAGCALLGGVLSTTIIEAFEQIHLNQDTYKKMSISENPYGNGDSSEIIKNHILTLLNGK